MRVLANLSATDAQTLLQTLRGGGPEGERTAIKAFAVREAARQTDGTAVMSVEISENGLTHSKRNRIQLLLNPVSNL